MYSLRSCIILTVGAIALAASAKSASADTVFASQAVSYASGANYATSYFTGDGYTTSAAALGVPTGVTGYDGFWGTSVVSVFSPPSDTNQIVSIGEGGHLTVRFPQVVYVKPGLAEIGVFANAGLVDSSYPSGVCASPAQTFSDNFAQIDVSANGLDWVGLGTLNLNMPTNFYLNAGPYDADAPASPQVADFGKPFSGGLSSFGGKTYPQILTLLDGSAGGNWLDLSSTGLSQVEYVRFSMPAGGINGYTYACVDAISVADAALAPVPEPTTLALLAIGGGLTGIISRRRRKA